MRKRGQLTVFLLEAGALLIVLGLVIFITTYTQEEKMGSSLQSQSDAVAETNRVRLYMHDCLKEVTRNAIELVSLQGGFIAPEGNDYYAENGTSEYNTSYYLYQETPVPAYLAGDNMSYPSRDAIEEKISRYVTVELQNCLDPSVFATEKVSVTEPPVNFSSQGFYNSSRVSVKTDISNESVAVKAEFPVTVRTTNTETRMKSFKTVIPHRLGYMHSILTRDTTGILPRINASWQAGSPFNLTNVSCDGYDKYNKTLVYKRGTDLNHTSVRVIQVADYRALNMSNKVSLFHVAINHTPLWFDGEVCNATHVP